MPAILKRKLVQSETAQRLTDSKIADVDISKFTFVYATSSTNINIAKDNSTIQESTVLGITLSDVLMGNSVDILLFGKLVNPAFVFPVNDFLFLNSLGLPTNTTSLISGRFHTELGKSHGSGTIFIDIKTPSRII